MSTKANGKPSVRFTRGKTCPICGGSEDDHRGTGRRCYGFLSNDGLYAHCTREDHAGQSPFFETSQTYSHLLKGECKCGREHGPADPKPAPTKRAGKGRGPIEATYNYRDEAGAVRYQVVRYKSKAFVQRQPTPAGGWAWNMDGVQRIPYRLPELLAAPKADVVIICEGEKDVDRVRAEGFVATCNAGGAGKWADELSTHLAGRKVVIIPDNDAPGRRHAEAVAASVKPHTQSVKVLDLVVDLPDLKAGGDLSDWLDAGRTVEDLGRLIYAAPEWMPTPPPSANGNGHHGGGGLVPTIAGPPGDRRFPTTDLGNAERLVARHGAQLRYVHAWKKWIVWDGRMWVVDSSGAIIRRAKETVRSIYREAAATGDDDDRKRLARWAMISESRKMIEAGIALAQSEKGIPVDPNDLDRDPMLLNVLNGTVDLRTGRISPHDPAGLITKLAPVDFDPAADCPLFLAFLDRITVGDADLIRFHQRSLGYSLTGNISEHALFFHYGTGRNGKSTLLGIVHRMLGTYATVLNAKLLTVRTQEDHPTELCDLDGARFVSTIELDDGKRMAEALVKSMTGGERIKARRMRADPYEFDPTFKLHLAANHKPEVRGVDEGIWSRIKLIPYTVTIPKNERDRKLPEKLWAEASGILNWLIRGCLEWQADGLAEPSSVAEATAEYRAEMDAIGDFIAESCVVLESARCVNNELYDKYKSWCEHSGVRCLSKQKFGAQMVKRGFHPLDSNSVRWRLGIGLQESRSNEPSGTF